MLPNKPGWLPDLVSTNGEWNRVVRMLYRIFIRDFKQTGCLFESLPVWWNQRRISSRYEEGFWHLITKFDYTVHERLLEPRRAERLPWCAPTIGHSSEPEVKVWRYLERRNRIRTYVWLEDWDYVVVLEERTLKGSGRRIAFLITAFHVGGKQSKEKLRKKYDNRLTQSSKCNHRP